MRGGRRSRGGRATVSGVELTLVCTVWARQSPDAPTTPRDWVSNSPQRRWESGAPARPAAVRNRGPRPHPRPPQAPGPSRILDRAHRSSLLSSVTRNLHARLGDTRAGSQKPALLTAQVSFLHPEFPGSLAEGEGCAKPWLSPAVSARREGEGSAGGLSAVPGRRGRERPLPD